MQNRLLSRHRHLCWTKQNFSPCVKVTSGTGEENKAKEKWEELPHILTLNLMPGCEGRTPDCLISSLANMAATRVGANSRWTVTSSLGRMDSSPCRVRRSSGLNILWSWRGKTWSIIFRFPVAMSAVCKHHKHSCDTKFNSVLEMHMNAVIRHFK